MKAKILGVKVGSDSIKVKSEVQTKDGKSFERVNTGPLSIADELTSKKGTTVDLKMTKEGEEWVITGINTFSGGSGGFKKGGFSKGAKRDPETDVRIARQSSLDRAVTITIHNSNGDHVTVDSIIETANRLVDYVMTGKVAGTSTKAADPDLEDEFEEDDDF